jgi:hypothetical protein
LPIHRCKIPQQAQIPTYHPRLDAVDGSDPIRFQPLTGQLLDPLLPLCRPEIPLGECLRGRLLLGLDPDLDAVGVNGVNRNLAFGHIRGW